MNKYEQILVNINTYQQIKINDPHISTNINTHQQISAPIKNADKCQQL